MQVGLSPGDQQQAGPEQADRKNDDFCHEVELSILSSSAECFFIPLKFFQENTQWRQEKQAS
jgi:hypothetical protein